VCVCAKVGREGKEGGGEEGGKREGRKNGVERK